MARRKRTTAAVAQAARHNIRRAQMSRVGRKEPRSIGRVMRSRARYSTPARAARRRSR